MWSRRRRPARTATGAWARPRARPVTSAPSDCSHSDSHAPLKPVWPVTSTRRRTRSRGRSARGRVSSRNRHAACPPPRTARPALRPPPARAEILGIPLAISDYDEVIDWMEAMIAAGRPRLRDGRGRQPGDVRARGPARRARRCSARRSRCPTASRSCGRCTRSGTRARHARLRPRPDGALLRARRGRGHADLPLRRPHARGARAARSAPARALPGTARSPAATRRRSAS